MNIPTSRSPWKQCQAFLTLAAASFASAPGAATRKTRPRGASARRIIARRLGTEEGEESDANGPGLLSRVLDLLLLGSWLLAAAAWVIVLLR